MSTDNDVTAAVVAAMAQVGWNKETAARLESVSAELRTFVEQRQAEQEARAKIKREEEIEAVADQMRGDSSFRAYAKMAGVRADEPERVRKEVLGRRFARYARAAVIAQKSGITTAKQLRNFGTDADREMAAELDVRQDALDRGDTRALSISSISGGGAVVPPGWSGELIALLRNETIVDKIPGITHVMMGTSELDFSRQTGAAVAYYLGESVAVTASDQSFGNRKLSRKKLIALTVFSNSLLRVADPSIDGVVLNDLKLVMGLRRDLAYLRGDGADNTPRGIRYWAEAANTEAQSATTTAGKIADLTRAIRRLKVGNVKPSPQNSAFIFSARTWGGLFNAVDANSNPAFQPMMNAGTIYGHPYADSNQIPDNLGAGTDSEMLFVNGGCFIIGDALEMDVTSSMEGSVNNGASSVSLLSTDQSAIRVVAEGDIIARYSEGVHVTTGVTWA